MRRWNGSEDSVLLFSGVECKIIKMGRIEGEFGVLLVPSSEIRLLFSVRPSFSCCDHLSSDDTTFFQFAIVAESK